MRVAHELEPRIHDLKIDRAEASDRWTDYQRRYPTRRDGQLVAEFDELNALCYAAKRKISEWLKATADDRAGDLKTLFDVYEMRVTAILRFVAKYT